MVQFNMCLKQLNSTKMSHYFFAKGNSIYKDFFNLSIINYFQLFIIIP